MCLPPFIADAILRAGAHSGGTQIMGRGIRRRAERLDRTDCTVDALGLGVGVFAHGDVVFVIIEVHIRHVVAPLILDVRIERNAVRLTRHVFTDEPHTRQIRIVIHPPREVGTPPSRIQKGCHERNTQRQRFEFVTADEPTTGIVASLVTHNAGHGRAAVHVHRLLECRINRPGHMAHVIAADLTRRIGQTVLEHVRSG